MAIAELGTTMLAISEYKRQSPAAGMSISMAVAGCVHLAIDKHSRLRCIETYSGERLSTIGASVRHPRLRYPRPACYKPRTFLVRGTPALHASPSQQTMRNWATSKPNDGCLIASVSAPVHVIRQRLACAKAFPV